MSESTPKKALVVEDELPEQKLYRLQLKIADPPYTAEIVDSKGIPLEDLATHIRTCLTQPERPDLLVLDGKYRDGTAEGLLKALKADLIGTRVIVHSADDGIVTAVKSAYPTVTAVVKAGTHLFGAIQATVPFAG